MKAQYHDIQFNLDQILQEELPYTRAFYSDGEELKQDIKDLFSFPSANSSNMPVYTLSLAECQNIGETFEEAYAMLVDAVAIAFKRRSDIVKFWDCELIRNHPYFIDYAIHTFRPENRKPAMYGRFDASFDPVSGNVIGLYEFNGDTPVMLFESVHLQDRITKAITGDHSAQFNEYWAKMDYYLRNAKLGYSAVVFDQNYIEDTATCETLAQLMGQDSPCMFVDFADLDFDMIEKAYPWVINDTHLDTVFVLSPWEEMVANFPYAFENWQDWANNVHLMEPAWRWFLSHKGVWAYVTHLMETDTIFQMRYGHLPVLETRLTESEFVKSGRKFVSKPVIGRLSSNVTIHNADGSPEFEAGGFYPYTERVYQEYCEPGHVDGRNNFILCMWMAPTPNEWNGNPRAECGTLCIREFDDAVLSLANERFIPHLIV